MKNKNFLLTFAAVLFALFLTDGLIHQVILKSTYQETASLWRTNEEIQNHLPSMILGQALVALFFTWIFKHGYRGTGWKEGVRFGCLIAGFQTGGQLIMYTVSPYPLSLLLGWIGLGFAQTILLGIVASKVYKN